MTHNDWIPDGMGNEFALFKDEQGISLVCRPAGDDDYTQQDPDVSVLTLTPSYGVYLAGSNAISPYPMNHNGAIQVHSDDVVDSGSRQRIL